MNFPHFAIAVFVTLGLGIATARADQANDTTAAPNVLILIADDLGWGDLSLHGNTSVDTPNLDALAMSGARLERFYVCPVCAPTRAELLTGRYHPRSGVVGVSSGLERMHPSETTIADTFRSAGYRTALFGKWHNGTQPPYHPNDRGFDEFYGFTSGHWGNYFDPLLDHNGEHVTGKGFLPNDLTDRLLEMVTQESPDPLFAILSFNTPHSPMQVPEPWWNSKRTIVTSGTLAGKENILHTQAALAMVENLDWNVGKVVSELRANSMLEETIMVFMSDNGPNGHRYNGGMRGIKGSTDEGGVRSPCFISYPSRIPEGIRLPTISGAIDLFPTLADLAGVRIPKSSNQNRNQIRREEDSPNPRPLDGVSISPLLLSASDVNGTDDAQIDPIAPNSAVDPDDDFELNPASPERLIFSHWANRVSVRSQNFRLDDRGRLYDMRSDPNQTKDCQSEFPDEYQRLSQAIERWRTDVLSKASVMKDMPFTVGGGVGRVTQLPARDADFGGSIKRSNRYPNCSFLTNWSEATDWISWPIEVLEAGNYQVEILYTLPQASVPTVLKIESGASRLIHEIQQPNDSPLRGMESDRFLRQESYVKSFAELALGTLSLEAGRQEFSIRAEMITNGQSIDLRMLTLRRVE